MFQKMCHRFVTSGESQASRDRLRKNLLLAGGQEDLLTVLSKWGADGEYIHGASRVPAYLGTPAEYWTDRRTV